MELLIQQCVNGISLGAVYAIFALGFGLLFSTTGVLNFAQGTFATWGAIPAYFLGSVLGIPIPIALVVGIVVSALIGLGIETLAFAPIRNRGGGFLGPLVASVGVWIALLGLAEIAIGQDARPMDGGGLESIRFHLGGVVVRALDIIAVVLCLLIAAGLHVLMTRTRFGLATRAVTRSERSARVAGVDPRRVLRIIVSLSAAITAVAGLLDGLITGSLTPQLGDGLLIIGFAVTVVGGVGDLRGTLLAGFAVGLIEVLSAQYLGVGYRDAVTFGLLLVFLVIRPRGIFGRSEGVRA
jgi:branched-chain amino acid transport system permease protein